MLIEILQDTNLHKRVREEVITTVLSMESKGDSTTRLDLGKLAALPLLKSIYMECLRLYASIPLTRMLRTDMDVDGYTLRRGNFILAPSYLAHYNENVWSVPGHPADTFWAERFLHKETADAGTKVATGDFFPYGGGLFSCPGRHFAKQELLAAVALLLLKFDFEFLGYVDRSGRPSPCGPKFREHFESAGVVQPDRDLLVRMHKV
jgi:cytochrome P450